MFSDGDIQKEAHQVMLKSTSAALAMLVWSGVCWGHVDELEKLNSVVERQQQEIEELKAQLGRIERALGLGAPATLQPVSYSPQAPQPAPVAQAVTTAPAPSAFPLRCNFPVRLAAETRVAAP